MFKQKFALFFLKALGWRLSVNTEDIKKCILCVAPHTSNWDFFFGKLAYTAAGRNSNFLIKDTWFFFPFNVFFNWIGGVPVDRGRRTNMTEKMAEIFSQREEFQLAITPEGTRKRNPNWKRGFYQIALKANIPIVLLYLDYKKKEAGLFDVFYPTGNEEEDVRKIKNYYKDVIPCKPDQFAI